jgi:hypothetical protein
LRADDGCCRSSEENSGEETKQMSEHEPKLEIVQMSGVDYFTVVDINAPKTEFYNYGILCDGCPTRADAEQFITEWEAEEKRRREEDAAEKDDDPIPF